MVMEEKIPDTIIIAYRQQQNKLSTKQTLAVATCIHHQTMPDLNCHMPGQLFTTIIGQHVQAYFLPNNTGRSTMIIDNNFKSTKKHPSTLLHCTLSGHKGDLIIHASSKN